MPLDPDDLQEVINEQASECLGDISNRLNDTREAISQAFEAAKLYYDSRHSPLPTHKPGDFVSVRMDRHPISIVKLNKLSAQKLPSYEVMEVLAGGRSLRLRIPENNRLGMHDVISVQNVHKAVNPNADPFYRSENVEPGPVEDDDGHIARIVYHRDTPKRSRKYLIRPPEIHFLSIYIPPTKPAACFTLKLNLEEIIATHIPTIYYLRRPRAGGKGFTKISAIGVDDVFGGGGRRDRNRVSMIQSSTREDEEAHEDAF
ncbi:hypothetical protein K440DRAFT_638127 [Wilcoxina mikolae CBS 423.85]|nr:hypothetical protein K440DRAFT_638127 [Wilcoxina mikolae CBS 423.85]